MGIKGVLTASGYKQQNLNSVHSTNFDLICFILCGMSFAKTLSQLLSEDLWEVSERWEG